MIGSDRHELYFYDLSDLRHFRFMGKYAISSVRNDKQAIFVRHGMVCKSKSGTNLKLLLFGGQSHSFIESFFEISINFNKNVQLSDINEKNFNQNIFFKENFIQVECDKSIIDMDINSQPKSNLLKDVYSFGYNTTLNSKKERIIILFGGLGISKSILLFNCSTNKLYVKPRVLPFACVERPLGIIHNNHIHVMGKNFGTKEHFSINLTKLFSDFGMKYQQTTFFWKHERLIWIAFEKNLQNKNCFIHLLSKDVLLKLLDYLRD